MGLGSGLDRAGSGRCGHRDRRNLPDRRRRWLGNHIGAGDTGTGAERLFGLLQGCARQDDRQVPARHRNRAGRVDRIGDGDHLCSDLILRSGRPDDAGYWRAVSGGGGMDRQRTAVRNLAGRGRRDRGRQVRAEGSLEEFFLSSRRSAAAPIHPDPRPADRDRAGAPVHDCRREQRWTGI